eukprot:scaffold871_cov130-Cylindrotheca_fusiformis.AAC.1
MTPPSTVSFVTQPMVPVKNVKEDEKTIPFLRRLVDMLRENEDVISFFPGSIQGADITLGRIVVHDRLQVEANVLPKYFNHSSFASLRRQLNYFSFTRLGKGRQRGATYCNEAVVDLDDILRLKRRSNTTPSPTTSTTSTANVSSSTSSTRTERINHLKRSRSVSVSSQEDQEEEHQQEEQDSSTRRPNKKSRSIVTTGIPKAVMQSRVVSEGEQASHDVQSRIALDLTVSPSTGSSNDADILAGCRALLSIANHCNSIQGWNQCY